MHMSSLSSLLSFSLATERGSMPHTDEGNQFNYCAKLTFPGWHLKSW